MSSSRRKRIERLVSLRARQLEGARTALAMAMRATQSAEEARDAAAKAWSDRAEALRHERLPTMDALVEARAHLDGLQRKTEIATATVVRVRGAQQVARDACVAADRELKKMEIWRDQLAEQERADEARKERILMDEVAARTYLRECA